MKISYRSVGVMLSFVFTMSAMSAQWSQTSGQSVIGADVFAASGTNLFAGTSTGGVYRSTNGGSNWRTVNSGLTNLHISALATDGTNLFAGTIGESGAHGITGGGIYLSTDNGASWTSASTGITNNTILALAISGTSIFAGTYANGVLVSTNNGASWTSAGLANTSVRSFAMIGGSIYAGTSTGVFMSTDMGATWKAMNTGLPTDLAKIPVYALAVSGSTIFAGTYNAGVFMSTDNGAKWTEVNNGLTNGYALSLAVIGNNLYAGTWGGGVFVSANNGTSWNTANIGLLNTNVVSLGVSGNTLFAGTEGAIFTKIEALVSVGSESMGAVITTSSLEANYPNPFNPTTNISFNLATRSFVSLKIYDLFGREVSEVVGGELNAGHHTRTWSAAGLPSGEYFYRLQTETFSDTKRLLVVK